jgi:hypothetical protein
MCRLARLRQLRFHRWPAAYVISLFQRIQQLVTPAPADDRPPGDLIRREGRPRLRQDAEGQPRRRVEVESGEQAGDAFLQQVAGTGSFNDRAA